MDNDTKLDDQLTHLFDDAEKVEIQKEAQNCDHSDQRTQDNVAGEASKKASEDSPNEDQLLSFEEEANILRTRLRDSETLSQKQRNKIKIIHDKVSEYGKAGVLTEEEQHALLDIVNIDAETLPEAVSQKSQKSGITKNAHIIEQYYDTWQKNLPVLKEIVEVNPEHINAFEHLVNMASKSELESIEVTLKSLESSPLKLTQKMLELGKAHYQEIYQPLSKHGGLKGLQIAHKKEVSQLKKEIAKLMQEMQEMAKIKDGGDYIHNGKKSYNIPSSTTENIDNKSMDDWDNFINKMA